MSKPGTNRTGKNAPVHSADSLFVMALVCVFAICSLFVILFGARVYNGIRNRSEDNYSTRTGLSYLRNKIRAFDETGRISGRGDYLLLTTGDDEYADDTYIYYSDGALRELTTARYLDVDPFVVDGDADMIVPASGFSIEWLGNICLLTLCSPDGTAYTCTVTLRSSPQEVTP